MLHVWKEANSIKSGIFTCSPLGRKDFDKKGEPCVSYDVVANPEAQRKQIEFGIHPMP